MTKNLMCHRSDSDTKSSWQNKKTLPLLFSIRSFYLCAFCMTIVQLTFCDSVMMVQVTC